MDWKNLILCDIPYIALFGNDDSWIKLFLFKKMSDLSVHNSDYIA